MKKTRKNQNKRLSDYSSGRLNFFKGFLKSIGVGGKEAALAMGVSKMTISAWFVRERVRLDQLMELADYYGYSFHIILSMGLEKPVTPLELVAGDFENKDGGFVIKRMAFLSFALREAKLSKAELSKRLGLATTTVHNWFKVDNISIKRIFDIAQTCGFNIYFSITPNKKIPVQEHGIIRVVSEVIVREEQSYPRK